jgi:amino acid transporter
LGLWDVTCLIVGIIVGAGIFYTPVAVLQNVSGPEAALGIWLLGGVLSLIGALCFAELASTYPRSGGEYVYLSRAYGRWVGFFFAWAQLAVIRTGGSIAAVAYVFADYARSFWDLGPGSAIIYAAGAIAVLTLINILGVNPSKRTQNVLTVSKVLGLGGIVLAGFFWAQPRPVEGAAMAAPTAGSLFLALLAVLYTYDGWNEAAYVAGEVRDRRRNLPRALMLGTAAVMVIYLLVNAAFLVGLGFDRARTSQAIAADVLAGPLGEFGGRAMSLLVMISVLGAIHGVIFASSRIYPELGADHRIFAPLAQWSSRLGTPVVSLLVQAAISIALVVGVGLTAQGQSGFVILLKYTSGVFLLFFLMTGISLFVLRWKDPGAERPYRVPWYPVLPLIFCGCCTLMLVGSVVDAPRQSLSGLGILLAGVPLYLLSRRPTRLPHSPLSGPAALHRYRGQSCPADARASGAGPLA